MKTITSLEDNLDLIEIGDKLIYLVGTAHVSAASAELVERVLRDVKPQSVCVELCEPRYQSLRNPQRWSDTDIFEVIRSGRAYLLMAQLALAGFQKRVAKRLSVRPGEEVLRAINVAEEIGASLFLVDRNVRTTLKRAWAKAGLWSFAKVVAALITSLFAGDEITEEEIEKLKSGDVLSAVLSEFSDILPGVKDALIDERDQYLAGKILQAEGERIVAVVGAGHVPGIKNRMGDSIDFAALEAIPRRGFIWTLLAWGVPLLILGIFVGGFFVGGLETSKAMIYSWFLVTGTLSAVAVCAALPHPLTVLSTFLAAPVATIHPLVATGWISGLVEAVVRKPRVRDFESIGDDITSVAGLWQNRVTRILLVVLFANLGALAGMYVGTVYIGSLLF